MAHDPSEAVFAGPDGLALMGTVIASAARLLRHGGLFAVEHDETQGDAVPALLSADGRWTDVADHRDLTGRAAVRHRRAPLTRLMSRLMSRLVSRLNEPAGQDHRRAAAR